jgi:Family of unknown function (DUF5670)
MWSVVVRGEAERCNEEVAPLVSQSRGELNLGMGTAYTGGGLVHVLLVIAAIVVAFQFLGGRRTV